MAEQKVKLTDLPAATDTIDTAQLLINQNSTDQKLPVTHFLRAKNNLSELADIGQARANLDVPSVDEVNDKLAGFIDGSNTFAAGASLSSRSDFIWDEESKSWYFWRGTLPKDVPAASSPASTGGVSDVSWGVVSDSLLRAELSDVDGFRLLGECPDIATLKVTEPKNIRQLIRVENYYSDKFGGGGLFRSVNPGTLSDDGGLYIKTTGGAVWRRVVEHNTVTTADYGCYPGNVGADNSARLVKACASGYKVVGLGENYNMTTITTSNLEISGKFTPSKSDFTASYGRVLLIFTGGKVKGDIFVDMLQFSAGGVIIRGSECEMSIRVENIEAGDRTVFGLQNGVQDEGLRNQLSIFCRAIHDAFGQVIPVQPAAFTIADTGGGGTYPVIDITDCNTAVINNGQGRGVHVGTYTARSIKYNVWYNLAGAYSDISDLFVENISGQVLTNSGGQLRVGRVYIKECTGYGINFSYNSSTTINEIIVDNHSPSSQMPLLWCRDTNEVSSLHVGSIKGTMTLAGGAATPGQGCMAFQYGINNITIGEVDLVMNYIASSYLGIISFLKCRSLVLGKWRLTLQDTTGTLTSSSIAFITPPDSTLVAGSSFGLQQYISTPARMQFNINGQQNISFAAGQPISSASGPYITSLVPNPVRIFQCPGLPTSGKWFSGDVVIVTAPSPTVKFGYRCIATGDFAGTAPTFQLIA
ncbi:hypothetical protein [Enterobacter cloacae complex sp. 743-2DZ2F-22B]|uniref:tail fiber/spike domain-containing protein n=1 Tax=Enterobacter cloacae complex sp. 743-2DZ2F-22B TaxID=2511985 RepID=UPI002107980D|nr:hypothetical protein [Enterobacter cloacae complex sp. 743-2DZ2F-22B]